MMKRFVKFYANYWVIFLIFVPIGIFVFERELGIPYGGGRGLKMLFTDLLGINGFQSYNITWWFNRLIIYFYLIFPLLYFFIKKWTIPMLIFGIIIWKLNIPIMFGEAHEWLLHFMFGIAVALNINKISAFLNRFNRWAVLFATVLVFCGLAYVRNFGIIPQFSGTRVDAFLAVTISLMVILTLRNIPYIRDIIKFLGKHSINIYLIHTFIYYYFFPDFIYSFKYPILIFAALLISSLAVSISIEFLKKAIHLPQLIKISTQKIDKIEF
jgi:peptidoglycan/LPS O-acetylase OafA/YrhL